jgi:hypothetical protein
MMDYNLEMLAPGTKMPPVQRMPKRLDMQIHRFGRKPLYGGPALHIGKVSFSGDMRLSNKHTIMGEEVDSLG